MTRGVFRRGLLIGTLTVLPMAGLWASVEIAGLHAQETAPPRKPGGIGPFQLDSEADTSTPSMALHLGKVAEAAIAMPIAAALGAALALRPRRRGTPQRSAPIVQTQVILAVIGALVMLLVENSLARAFGVVGAAGLVRYRAKVQDPKDAGVMLSTLALGLASGVGMYLLAGFAALFIMAVLWIIESFEPEAYKVFVLKIATKDARATQPQLEALLRRQHAGFELRASAEQELSYEVRLPMNRATDTVTKGILGTAHVTSVEWTEQKKKAADEA
jgi:uncharacterized protein DUF4956